MTLAVAANHFTHIVKSNLLIDSKLFGQYKIVYYCQVAHYLYYLKIDIKETGKPVIRKCFTSVARLFTI